MTPTALLTIWIAANFPDSAGYNATMRADLLAYALTINSNTDFAAADSPGPVEGLLMAEINSSVYANLPTDKKLLVLQMCEYAVFINFTNTVTVNGPKTFMAKITQAGVAAPTYARIVDTISGVDGGGAPVTPPVMSRNGVGDYRITFTNSVFPDLSKVAAYIINTQSGVNAVAAATGLKTVDFGTQQESTDTTVPGMAIPLSGNPADALLFGQEILVITVYA